VLPFVVFHHDPPPGRWVQTLRAAGINVWMQASSPELAAAVIDGGAPDTARRAGLEVYGDSAYGTGAARAAYQCGGHDTVIKPKPLLPAVAGGFTLDDFTIGEAAATVTCPGRAHPHHDRQTDGDLRRGVRRFPAASPLHHGHRRPLDEHPPL
jgi:hypothetical protein